MYSNQSMLFELLIPYGNYRGFICNKMYGQFKVNVPFALEKICKLLLVKLNVVSQDLPYSVWEACCIFSCSIWFSWSGNDTWRSHDYCVCDHFSWHLLEFLLYKGGDFAYCYIKILSSLWIMTFIILTWPSLSHLIPFELIHALSNIRWSTLLFY